MNTGSADLQVGGSQVGVAVSYVRSCVPGVLLEDPWKRWRLGIEPARKVVLRIVLCVAKVKVDAVAAREPAGECASPGWRADSVRELQPLCDFDAFAADALNVGRPEVRVIV